MGKKVIRLTESDLVNIINRVINESTETIYNYFKMVDSDGEVVGVGAVENGSKNELMIIDKIFEMGLTPVIISKKEYDEFDDGDEIRNF